MNDSCNQMADILFGVDGKIVIIPVKAPKEIFLEWSEGSTGEQSRMVNLKITSIDACVAAKRDTLRGM